MVEQRAEFLHVGAAPFALKGCERLAPELVSGYYDAASQKWVGDGALFAATRTVTATTLGQDGDLD